MRVVLFGAAGMLGRPVARALAADGSFTLRAMVRDVDRARAALPELIELVEGDLRDDASILAALDGADAAYLSLNTPHDPKAPFDPDRDGTVAVVRCLQGTSVGRVVRLSSLETGDRPRRWWVLERKREGDEALIRCPVAHTIFRPTWFMESLAMFVRGRRVLSPGARGVRMWWLSASDYGRQVGAALRSEGAAGRVLVAQGPERVSVRDAVRRFARAHDPPLRPMPLPRLALRAARWFDPSSAYLDDLLRVTGESADAFGAQETWNLLGEPRERIEDYARSISAGAVVSRR